MKITQSKVRVEPNKAISTANDTPKLKPAIKAAVEKATAAPAAPSRIHDVVRRTLKPAVKPKKAADGFMGYSETAIALRQVLAKARNELKLIQQMKDDTARYQQRVAAQARSEAHQLVLNARIATHAEINAVVRKASEEIQQVLADIRVTRITAQEELNTMRRYTDAAKLNNLSLSIQNVLHKPAEPANDKKPEGVKP